MNHTNVSDMDVVVVPVLITNTSPPQHALQKKRFIGYRTTATSTYSFIMILISIALLMMFRIVTVNAFTVSRTSTGSRQQYRYQDMRVQVSSQHITTATSAKLSTTTTTTTTTLSRTTLQQAANTYAATTATRNNGDDNSNNYNNNNNNNNSNNNNVANNKKGLLDLIINQTPTGQATSKQVTKQILDRIQFLEQNCPCNNNNSDILTKLSGNWELLWTAQDPNQPETKRFGYILNPIENQSYSNNPEGASSSSGSNGRSNPFLPIEIQNKLEELGIIPSSSSSSSSTNSNNIPIRRSTQSIDIQTGIIRNIVTIPYIPPPLPSFLFSSLFTSASTNTKQNDSNIQQQKQQQIRRISLTVVIQFTPVLSDLRKINVKFLECRISIPSLLASLSSSSSSIKQNNNFILPLGIIGPTGWLRTVYIDDTLRITRGHKGSVFVLSRPRRAAV